MDNNGVLEDIEPQINGNDMEAKILGKISLCSMWFPCQNV